MFKEYPYLYDGNLEYEKIYLSRYSQSDKSLVVLALVNGYVVGASSCLPLESESEELKTPLMNIHLDIEQSFYFGESLLLANFRGMGIGHEFFKIRENHAQKVFKNLTFTCFCSVERLNHPLIPTNYKPLNSFWNRMGYIEQNEIIAYYPWKDIDKDITDNKKMVYWIKEWN